MKRLNKFVSLAVLGVAIAFPLMNSTPALAGLQEMGDAIVSALNRPKVDLNLTAAKQIIETDSQGKQQISWQPIKDNAVVAPGDILLYTISTNNTGDRPATNFGMTQPIPKGTVYMLSTASSDNQAKITYSIDNGKTFAEKPMVQEKLADGKVEEKPAPPEAYTHVRWQFDNSIKPNSVIKAAYNVKVQ
jgi:uncharacterized repeat protein (TIGR01451 family)